MDQLIKSITLPGLAADPMPRKYNTLRLILGDQLNHQHTWFCETQSDVLYVIAEVQQELAYVRHHVQKICAFFAAMAEFARYLTESGHQVLHLNLDDTARDADLPHVLARLCRTYGVQALEYQRPDEYRLREQLRDLKLPQAITLREIDTEHFLLPFDEISRQFPVGEHVTMEHFYRRMRKRFSVLMDGDKPTGGKWNFDASNRQKLKPADLEQLPEPLVFANDVSAILARIACHSAQHFGTPTASLPWPVNRTQAEQLLVHFCHNCLFRFGRYQDAMTGESPFGWSLYHSRLSFAINAKILHPKTVLDKAIETWQSANGDIDIAQVEGFVRQILGWREYVRGMYWANMPDYASSNALHADRSLPDYFWSGKTRMACMGAAIGQSLDHAYAHHIQRLMVIGNFCLLTGIHPDKVDAWYLGVYIDAIEWVEMPNTRGMSQYADGGLVATKPYAASGNYINKMSDYCNRCYYRVKEKTGSRACPFNSLYWLFMDRHRQMLETNPRIGVLYRNWDRQSSENRQAVLDHAEWCKSHIEEL